ncbi:AbgT family transporter [Vibrio cyclitrophicus]|uniref:AbgT family transporter n=1 Tax=Vibrio cyclitrophicus TaxID=47951 RepID=UPI0024112FE2|nr:AbgT family transporter [Vibrio cyclitrophicus]
MWNITSEFTFNHGYMQSYKPGLRISTLIATMLPLAIGFLVFWTTFLLLWTGLGLDVGPGVSMYIN